MKDRKFILLLFSTVCLMFTTCNMLSACVRIDLIVYKDSSVFSIPSNEYKIIKIKKRTKFYIIYAKRDNKVYKIISIKDKYRCSKKNKIHHGKEYKLTLESYFLRYDKDGIRLPHPGETGAGGLYIFGEAVDIEETENDVWDLFKATNLKGLYIDDGN